MKNIEKIFQIKSEKQFNSLALEIFKFQYRNNHIYRSFVEKLNINVDLIVDYHDIPFMPIEFFKSFDIVCDTKLPDLCFLSSGTTGQIPSKHFIVNPNIYIESFRKSFALFYGDITNYCVMGLLPSYLERGSSSLVFMVNDMIQQSGHSQSGFYLNNLEELAAKLQKLDSSGQKIVLIGVTYALLDLIENFSLDLKNTIIVETGGMKGRRKEMIRQELHKVLERGFSVSSIHSEYGMTELLSQAWSKGDGVFVCPPWMKILIRQTNDPLSFAKNGKTGGINVIDLANINSCSFIATQDLGRSFEDESFTVAGRFDNSDVRGCNLMI